MFAGMFGEVDDDVTINPDSPKSIADDNNSRLELVDLGDDNSVFQDDGQDKIAHENVAPPKSRRAIQNSLENVQSYPKVVSVVEKVKATKSKEKNDEKKKFEPQSSVAQQKVHVNISKLIWVAIHEPLRFYGIISLGFIWTGDWHKSKFKSEKNVVQLCKSQSLVNE
mmetsp:Transcript_37672/g.60453  ORF Transcript_37672/g.60453 Transcript_37672/m.60453 type:complete len:167 (+) Transcript_37672:82-582(+)